MQITISVLDNFLLPNTDLMSAELNQAIKESTETVRNTAVSNIDRGERHGVMKKRLKKSRRGNQKFISANFNRRSAEGEYPKTDTSRLVTSIHTEYSFLTGVVGSTVNYSAILETKDPAQGGRPWLMRSYNESLPQIGKFIEEAIKRAFSR